MDTLDLLEFMPFRLNRLAAEFSNALSSAYAGAGIDIPEWRVLATLGMRDEPRSASYVVRCTRTHKSRISRAVNHLLDMNLVERKEGGDDGREIMLRLSPEGRRIYRDLLPQLRAREEELLSCLSDDERACLRALIGKLEGSLNLVRSGGDVASNGEV